MCVIAVCIKKLPTEDELCRMESANHAGGGMAWIEGGRVHWAKGYRAKHLAKLAEGKPLPVVFHFRLATVGGNDKLLSHPFPISEKAELWKNGTAGAVLFHNGHEGDYKKLASAAGLDLKGIELKGPMSDSRALAAITARNGNPAWLVDASGKFVVLDTVGPLRIGHFEELDGIFYSNTFWKNRAVTVTGWDGAHGWCGDDDGAGYWNSRPAANPNIGRSTCYDSKNKINRYIDTGEHTHWCGCRPCASKKAAQALLLAGTNCDLSITGHEAGCVCLPCKVVRQFTIIEHHADSCPCRDCDKWLELVGELKTQNKEHSVLCDCAKCREARAAKAEHPPACGCPECIKRKAGAVVADMVKTVLSVADENSDERAAITIPIHGHECDCEACKADRITSPPTGERPENHGDDCRCQQCRAAIDGQILADQERALQAQADAHLTAIDEATQTQAAKNQ